MPVEDHPIHEKTRQGSDARYGCWGRERRREPLLVKNGHTSGHGDFEAVQRLTLIPDHGSVECRYDMSLSDQKCAGCQHRGSGERYAESVKAKAKEAA